MSDIDLDDLLEDDPETKYHPPDEIKSIEAMKLDQKMCALFVKNKKMDPEEGKMKIETLTSMIELAENNLKMDKDGYVEGLKDAWAAHKEWQQTWAEDMDLGTAKNGHITRIKKRAEKIEAELKKYGVDPNMLEDDEDEGILRELNSDESDTEEINDIDEHSDDNRQTNYRDSKAHAVKKMPTMEEKKEIIDQRSSAVVSDIANRDPEDLMEERLREYINAIEYLKKNNLSKDQKAILAILERAEKVKKLQKRGDVDVFEIPAPIVPEDLLGMSIQARVKKYQTLVNIINKTANNLKIIGSNNFNVFKKNKNKVAKENYDKAIFLFKKQNQLKADLLKLAKNKWQPMPEISTQVESFPDPKGTDLEESEVKVKLTIPEDFQNIGKYYYKFKWMDDDQDIKKIKVNNKGEVIELGHNIDFGHHKKFSALKVVIKIRHWRWGFFDKTKFVWENNLMALKKGAVIKKNFKFEDHKFYVTIFSDLQSEEALNDLKIVDAAYIPPPFKSAEGGAPKKFRRTTVTRRETMREAAAENEEAKQNIPIPEGVGADEIKEPDVQRNLWSCYYCKLMYEKYQEIVNTSMSKKKPVDNMISTKLLLFQSQMMGIQSAIENEQVSFDQYMGYLNKGVEHDKILLQYFEDTGESKKADQVRFRIEWFEKEINGEVEETEDDETPDESGDAESDEEESDEEESG